MTGYAAQEKQYMNYGAQCWIDFPEQWQWQAGPPLSLPQPLKDDI
jgi:hypothetical protein